MVTSLEPILKRLLQDLPLYVLLIVTPGDFDRLKGQIHYGGIYNVPQHVNKQVQIHYGAIYSVAKRINKYRLVNVLIKSVNATIAIDR